MDFLGYELNGHIVAASCPATENIENVKLCAENGAAAIILKSASSTRLNDGKTRHCYIDDTGFWAESGFDREIMTINQAIDLTRNAINAVSVPIISSVTELTLDIEPWLTSCQKLEQAGANAVQLDFFYLPNLLSDEHFASRFINLLHELKSTLNIPVMPKLNIGLPAEFAVFLLNRAGIKYVSLLDSIKSPTPNGAYLSGESLSIFGSFQLPLTRQYTKTLSDSGFEVCAGGGVVNAKQAADLLSLGAKAVQIATEVLLNGFARFSELEYGLSQLPPVSARSPHLHISKAFFNAAKCTGCGKCSVQTFCTAAKTLSENNENCEGCGLCAGICKSGAISMAKTDNDLRSCPQKISINPKIWYNRPVPKLKLG